MDSARVAHTTLSARSAADFAYAAFDIPRPQCFRLASRGFNDVYEIDGLYLRIDRSVDLVASQLPHRADLVGHLRSLAVRIRAQVPPGLSVGLCHGDCHGWNATIEQGGAILFDFDECGIGPQAYDIATFLWGCTQVSPALRLPRWPRFVDGYNWFTTSGIVPRIERLRERCELAWASRLLA